MYQTLYRKYRPRSFSDVCGQARITTVLRRQVAEGTLTHAYLFCGTRGTGKTTCAKILAKVSNCLEPRDGEPCNECENCLAADRGELLDILEVDAASNTGVENIRRLCEELNFLPAQGKKRVYIIDEVHMLSIGAFNALLKTLEEPPSHALFILATTELHKVPATVRSRCQCFTFHRISVDDIADRVLKVSKTESIPLDETGARLIARLSDGAMRDALSLLELCVGHTTTLDEMELDRLFGLGDGEFIKDLALSSLGGDSTKSLALLDSLYQSMGDLKEVLSQLLGAYRDMLLYRVGVEFETSSNRTEIQQSELKKASKTFGEERILFAVSALEEALSRFDRLSVNKKIICEMALMRICNPSFSQGDDALLNRVVALEEKLANGISISAPAKEEKTPSLALDKETEKPEENAEAELETVPWEETPLVAEEQRTSTPVKETVVPFVKLKKEISVSGCSYASELVKKLCESNPMYASMCVGLSMVEENGVLCLYGERFTVMMLQPREAEILDLARSFSPGLTAVKLLEGKPPMTSEKRSDLGGF